MHVVDALQYSHPSRERFLEWRDGGLDLVHVTVAVWEDAKETLREIGRWNRRFREHADLIAPVRTVDEVDAVAASDRTGVVLGAQNTTPFEEDLDLVAGFHEAGLRIAQLTYNAQNAAGGGCWEDDRVGLSQTYGRTLIREMNRVGMLVDVSHSNDRTCLEAVEASEAPVALTHANPHEIVGPEVELSFRNKSNDVLRAVAESGGAIGLSMYPRMAPNGQECTLREYCEMIAWTADLVGVEHVGFGSDFYTGHPDGAVAWWRQGRWSRQPLVEISRSVDFPAWFSSPADYPAVISGLSEVGFDAAEVGMISGGNWLRVLGDATEPGLDTQEPATASAAG